MPEVVLAIEAIDVQHGNGDGKGTATHHLRRAPTWGGLNNASNGAIGLAHINQLIVTVCACVIAVCRAADSIDERNLPDQICRRRRRALAAIYVHYRGGDRRQREPVEPGRGSVIGCSHRCRDISIHVRARDMKHLARDPKRFREAETVVTIDAQLIESGIGKGHVSVKGCGEGLVRVLGYTVHGRNSGQGVVVREIAWRTGNIKVHGIAPIPDVIGGRGRDIGRIGAVPRKIQAGQHRVGAVNLVGGAVAAIIGSAWVDGSRQATIDLHDSKCQTGFGRVGPGQRRSQAGVQRRIRLDGEGPRIGRSPAAAIAPNQPRYLTAGRHRLSGVGSLHSGYIAGLGDTGCDRRTVEGETN